MVLSPRDHLKSVPWFQNLSDPELQELAGAGRSESWEEQRTVFLEGARPDNLYVILSGRVNVYKKNDAGLEVGLATLGAGDFFGEFALMDDAPRSASVSTIDRCEFFVLGRDEFIELLVESPRLVPGLLANISSKIRSINEKFFLEVLEKQALRLETERHRYRSLAQFAAEADEGMSVEDAMQAAIDRICAFTDWPIGHVYTVDKNAGGDLFSSSVWHLKRPEPFAAFRTVSEIARFGPGMELPGTVLANGTPFWTNDLTQFPDSPRTQVASDLGMRAGFGFPVLAGKEVVAVLEFFSDKPAKPDELLVDALASIGIQLGRRMERKQWEEQLLHNAFHDALTDLPNRALFLDRLGLSVERGKRQKDYLFAVLFLDLDGFKLVNDSLGHGIGDQLLVEVGRRLRVSVRATDTAARLGGDEFAVLLDDVKHVSDIPRTVERIRKDLHVPLQLQGQEVFISASLGIALSSTGYAQAEDLLRDADIAMYRAKARGRGQREIFEPKMHEDAVRQLRLETDLRKAVDRQELVLHYQPIVSLYSTQTVGFEALIRWRHPERGLMRPAEFIPMAETTELIIPITHWVLQEAGRQLRDWQTRFPVPLTVSVNLPSKYLARPSLPKEIAAVLSAHGLDPGSFCIEITESQIMENVGSVSKILLQLRELGVKVYIDDFGTGYSSLSSLCNLPLHSLKIDQTFVGKLIGDEKNAAIVRSTVLLARNLGLDTIAEGVETKQQLDYLQNVKCQYGQGYLFSRPLEPDQVAALFPEQVPTEKKCDASRLHPFELFPGLQDEELAEIAQSCMELTAPPGTVLIRQGQVGKEVFLMEEGSVGVYREEGDSPQLLVVLQAPTVFGEMAVVNPERIRTATVKALTDLHLLTLPITPLLSFIQRFPLLRANLLELVAERSLR